MSLFALLSLENWEYPLGKSIISLSRFMITSRLSSGHDLSKSIFRLLKLMFYSVLDDSKRRVSRRTGKPFKKEVLDSLKAIGENQIPWNSSPNDLILLNEKRPHRGIDYGTGIQQ